MKGSLDVQADGSGMSFVAYYVKDGKAIAVASVAKDPVVSHASELMRLGRMPSAEMIRSGLDILTIAL